MAGLCVCVAFCVCPGLVLVFTQKAVTQAEQAEHTYRCVFRSVPSKVVVQRNMFRYCSVPVPLFRLGLNGGVTVV